MGTAARHMLLLGSAALWLGLIVGGQAEEQIRSTTADVILSPDAFHGRAVALGGCRLGQLPEGPACWVLVNGRSAGVIPLQDVPAELTQKAQDTCPRAGIANGQACLVRVFGRVEKGSTVGLALRSAAIKWPE
jgi:hypothetical protein